jgi:hypothetical protein
MDPTYLVQDIARLLAIPARRVRYVLDHGVLPGYGGRTAPGLAGSPREFTPFEAFAVAAAAVLAHAGAQRGVIAAALVAVADAPWPLPGRAHRLETPMERATGRPRTAIAALYPPPGGEATLRVGDGVYFRVDARGRDTGWLDLRTRAALAAEYRPRAVLELDAGAVAAALRAGARRRTRTPKDRT